MESVISSASYFSQQSLSSSSYFNSFLKLKPYEQKSSRNKQRLIPLTREINKVMMDFNASHSSSNLSEKPSNNTLSITRLVRSEVQNTLEELSISDQYIRKEEIYDLIENCLKGKLTLIHENDGKTESFQEVDIDLNQEFEVTAEEVLDDKDKIIIENMQILEQRIIQLEDRLSCMLKNVPKLRSIQAKQFKLNINALIEEIRKAVYKNESEKSPEIPQHKENTEANVRNQDENLNTRNELDNKYDEMYYTSREFKLNLLNYKKSLESLELNQRPKFNPYVKPLNIALLKTKDHFKQKPMFLTNNNL